MVVRIIKKKGIWADTFNQTRRTKKLNANRSPLKFSRRINSGTVHLPRAFHKKSECIPVVILPACVGEDIVCETWLSTLLCDVTGSVVNSKMKEGIRTKSRFFFSVTLSYSYHVLTSSVIYFWTDARHHGILWFVNQILGLRAQPLSFDSYMKIALFEDKSVPVRRSSFACLLRTHLTGIRIISNTPSDIWL